MIFFCVNLPSIVPRIFKVNILTCTVCFAAGSTTNSLLGRSISINKINIFLLFASFSPFLYSHTFAVLCHLWWVEFKFPGGFGEKKSSSKAVGAGWSSDCICCNISGCNFTFCTVYRHIHVYLHTDMYIHINWFIILDLWVCLNGLRSWCMCDKESL